MKLHQQVTSNVNTIRATGADYIRINDESYTSSLIVMPDRLEDKWPIERPEQLDVATIGNLLTFQAEIILVGTGTRHHLLDPQLYVEATRAGIGIEIMTTEAACRTYNILVGEDRAVLAALILEKQ